MNETYPQAPTIDAYYDIKETAATLSVSSATIRNWMKAGKLTPAKKQGTTLLFNKSEIEAIKEEIASGKSHRLKSRRNKKAVIGHFIPTEYVSSKAYLTIAENILNWLNDESLTVDPALILHEIVLNLLAEKQIIDLSQLGAHQSLTEALIEKQLPIGSYQYLLNDLYQPESPLQEKECVLIRKIRDLNIPYIEGDDLLGLLYMSLSSLSARKNKGAYYTPSDIVNQLIDQSLNVLDNNAAPKAVDPCCGSGNFLIKLFIALKKLLIEKGMSLKEAEEILLTRCLYGYDIDPLAIKLARINIILLLETSFEELSHHPLHFHCQNTLATHGTLFNDQLDEVFDLVIGNPPWGYSFSRQEASDLRERFNTAKGALESFCLFVEYGIQHLKPQGILSYVLPESLLNVQIHETTRRMLVDGTQICQISILGHRFSKVFAPSILLTVRGSLPTSCDHQVIIHNEGETHTIAQSRFANNQDTIFNVKASDAEEHILEHMRTLNGAQFLSGQADFALGIVTGNNKHFLLDQPAPGAEPILKGGNVFKYNFYTGENYLVFDHEQFQQVAPEKWYRAPEKLIYRFINENLVFAYDNNGTLSLNSANIVIPRIPGVQIKYILAVLNSRPAQFFHQITFSSVKVLRNHIESIPIPPCAPEEENTILTLVDQLLETEDASERISLYEKIDQMIMSLYQFNSVDQDIIKRKVEQIKFLTR